MSEKDAYTGGSDLSDVSDGALRKAIQATENAQGSIKYAQLMIGGDGMEERTAAYEADSANWHIMELYHRLIREWDKRNLDTDSD